MTPIDIELERFKQFLSSVHGLAPSTCKYRLAIVRQFLQRKFKGRKIDMAAVRPGDLDGFLMDFASRWKPASLGVVRASLRSYLRFRAVQGDETASLAASLPVVAPYWNRANIPTFLRDRDVRLFLQAFDRSSPTGLRDYAAARCLLDLGLRGHEVAQLHLESFDWHRGIVTVSRSKSRRCQTLPLPRETGEAIVNYLRNGRPESKNRAVFVRHYAPYDKPLTQKTISTAMTEAFVRCGLGGQFSGTHVLRRTLAVRLQRAGMSLKDIADILRHKNLTTTTVYTTVDLEAPSRSCTAVAREAVMKTSPMPWTKLVEQYVSYRRKLGFALSSEENTLLNFARFAEKVGHQGPLTIALASQWAESSRRGNRLTSADRIQRLRGFAKYCQRLDTLTEVPPRQLFGTASRRLIPHIFTEKEIQQLMETAASLRPKNKLRPITCRTLLGLLVSTGLRISEATNLTRADVDLNAGVLTIREAKRHKQRLVPLHPSAVLELRAYAQLRDRLIVKSRSNFFFLFDSESRADPKRMRNALQFLCQKLGWKPRGEHKHFRLYDFRHVFIVRSLLQSHHQGTDVHKFVLALSTYVGHSDVASTYWYVTGIPELMSIAANRFHMFAKEGPNE